MQLVSMQSAANVPKQSAQKREAKSESKDDFTKMLESSLGGKEIVSEEELFSAVARERIFKLKGEKEAKSYDSILEGLNKSIKSFEDMAKAALNQLVSNKKLSQSEAEKVYSESFAAAQIDHKKDALYDGFGDTKAVDSKSSAIARAKSAIEAIEKGQSVQTRSPGEPSTGGSTLRRPSSSGQMDGRGGFRYTAFNDTNGVVQVKAPGVLTGLIDRVELRDSSGRVLESAKTFTIPGVRNDQARFKRSGSEYPAQLTVNFVLKTGGTESFFIKDSSLEWD